MNISPELANSVLETLAQDIRDAQPADPTDVEGLQALIAEMRRVSAINKTHYEELSAKYNTVLEQVTTAEDALVQAFVLVDNAIRLRDGFVHVERGKVIAGAKLPEKNAHLRARDADLMLKSVLSVIRERLPNLVETVKPWPGPSI